MNPFIAALFGQQIAPDLVDEVEEKRDADGAIIGNEIVSEGFRSKQAPVEVPMGATPPGPMPQNIQPTLYDNMILGNNRAIEQRDRAIAEGQAAAEPRKGAFGVKGTLRDVLGILGDAFLVQSGNKPVYSAVREKEKLSDAMAGFTKNPRAASERMAQVSPEAGRGMYEFAEDMDLKTAQAESLGERRDMLNTKDTAKIASDFTKFVGAVTYDDKMFDPATGNIKPEAYSLLSNMAAASGFDPEEFGITEDMNRETSRAFSFAAMTPKQQADIKKDLANLGIAQQNANTRAASVDVQRYRANIAAKAAAARSGRLPTYASILSEMLRIPPNERTPDERNFIAKYGQPTTTGTTRPSRPAAPAANTSRFRPARNN